MRPKSALKVNQLIADELKKSVDSFNKTCEGRTDNDEAVGTKLYEEGFELRTRICEHINVLNDLKKEDEPVIVAEFDKKKQNEIQRLEHLKERIDKHCAKLSPDATEEDYFRRMKEFSIKPEDEQSDDESEEEDDDDDDDDEDDDDDDEEDEEDDIDSPHKKNIDTSLTDLKKFEAISDFKGEDKGDLNFKVGDILHVFLMHDDGWWEAEDKNGKKGLVPMTYLKALSSRYDSCKEGSPESPRKNKHAEDGRKQAKQATDDASHEQKVAEVLLSMGAIPSGFRYSYLGELLHKPGGTYSTGDHLHPILTHSQLSFEDLHWDAKQQRMKVITPRLTKLITLVTCRNIPIPGAGLEVLSRHVRIALFNGEKVLSNIHTVKATWAANDPKTWRFSPKTSGILPSTMDGNLYVRCNEIAPNIGLLIQLCVTVLKTSTREKCEVSSGYVFVKLVDELITPLDNRTYDCYVNGGSPFEKSIPLDHTLGSPEDAMTPLMSSKTLPLMIFKIVAPSKNDKLVLDDMPPSFIGCMCNIHMYSMYRQMLAETVIAGRQFSDSTQIIHHPVLASFSKAANSPDLIDALRSAWAEQIKVEKRANKKNMTYMKELFVTVTSRVLYPLLHSSCVPTDDLNNAAVASERWQALSTFVKTTQQNSVLSSLLSADIPHRPFDMNELMFDLNNPKV